ncbi:retron system putative HNH endonuclease [Candidatus Lokiarchaeum ossiferum]|uniref:retron system putative HNH endonuclease n=1 Tax=Candidatus Lokiarchaeum ossiferum TaxID=2951803 RepID=UPI00352D864C
MIKIDRSTIDPPAFLENYHKWVQEEISNYSSPSEILSDKKKYHSIKTKYRSYDIYTKTLQKALKDLGNGKCAYCETSLGDKKSLQIEHFKPNGIPKYLKLTCDWTNLLPSCISCNSAKLEADPEKDPIIDPSIENPEPLFIFDPFTGLIATNPKCSPIEKKMADNTIEIVDLNREELIIIRAAHFEGHTNELQINLGLIWGLWDGNRFGGDMVSFKKIILKIDELEKKTSEFSAFGKIFKNESKLIKSLQDVYHSASNPSV